MTLQNLKPAAGWYLHVCLQQNVSSLMNTLCTASVFAQMVAEEGSWLCGLPILMLVFSSSRSHPQSTVGFSIGGAHQVRKQTAMASSMGCCLNYNPRLREKNQAESDCSGSHCLLRFGDGYTVRVWLCKETSQHSSVSDYLKLYFPRIQFKGQHLNLLEYHVPKRWGYLADLFKVLENNKDFLKIKHYSINQTTLEQVFINFASEQRQTPQSALDPSTDCHHPHRLPI
ncbi:ATP-binding cassette sub-family A member 13-like [Carlito syrichta]|uniref:ATP-binding cassette sub-family A member 13-like n=1 Tax=Carlito syrichta TaxID=1868482 RepID=A0A1U7SYA7_CARSF|nr:ATP-binding cassette sub-family A member 13-like [Carlito syrichta]